MIVKVCTGPKCRASFSEYILKRLLADKEKFATTNIAVESCPCTGNCKDGPIVFIDNELCTRMDPSKASETVLKRIKNSP